MTSYTANDGKGMCAKILWNEAPIADMDSIDTCGYCKALLCFVLLSEVGELIRVEQKRSERCSGLHYESDNNFEIQHFSVIITHRLNKTIMIYFYKNYRSPKAGRN